MRALNTAKEQVKTDYAGSRTWLDALIPYVDPLMPLAFAIARFLGFMFSIGQFVWKHPIQSFLTALAFVLLVLVDLVQGPGYVVGALRFAYRCFLFVVEELRLIKRITLG